MNLHIWDVQHGSAAYLRTPKGKHVVIDLGIGNTSQGDAIFSPLTYLRSLGVSRLDAVVVTHPHRDHLDDVFRFDEMSPRVFVRPRHLSEQDIRAGNKPGDRAVLDRYFEIDRSYTDIVQAAENPNSAANSGMEIAFFSPMTTATSNLNNHSIVVFMRSAGSVVCLPGDNEAASWRELLANSNFCDWLRQTDILVAAHHGREAGYCDDIFQYCSPRLVVVSDGSGCDTSAVDKYSRQAQGWVVTSRSTGERTERNVVTTRSDGSIYVHAGTNGAQRFLAVSVE